MCCEYSLSVGVGVRDAVSLAPEEDKGLVLMARPRVPQSAQKSYSGIMGNNIC